jgi:hypothetical protein
MLNVPKNKPLTTSQKTLTPAADKNPALVAVDDSKRLKEIRKLVEANNESFIDTNTIICHIYMESRFDADAHASGSTARGLLQLLKGAVRELYRVENLRKPKAQRTSDEATVYHEADKFHDSTQFVDEGTNIRAGTRYLEILIQRQKRKCTAEPIVEAYKDYRGRQDGVYYRKIKAGSEKLRAAPDSMQVLRDMVK